MLPLYLLVFLGLYFCIPVLSHFSSVKILFSAFKILFITLVYLKTRDAESFHVLVCSPCVAARAGQAEAQIQELTSGLLCRWQEVNHLDYYLLHCLMCISRGVKWGGETGLTYRNSRKVCGHPQEGFTFVPHTCPASSVFYSKKGLSEYLKQRLALLDRETPS